MKFRALRADEIECRVGMIREEKEGCFTLLLYKDARCDMNILDEAGAIWTRRHYECKGNLFCEVGIYNEDLGEFVFKSDCGTESNTEKEKGEASDSFKRACVNWGIGRALYTAPQIYIKGHVKKLPSGKLVPDFKSIRVVEIGYGESETRITRLVISGDGETIFEWGRNKHEARPAGAKPTTGAAAAKMTLEEALSRKSAKGVPFGEFTTDQLAWTIENAKNEQSREAARLILEYREKEFEPLGEFEPQDPNELPF